MQEKCRFLALICIESMQTLNSAPLDDDRLQPAQPQLGRHSGESAPSHVSKAFLISADISARVRIADVKVERIRGNYKTDLKVTDLARSEETDETRSIQNVYQLSNVHGLLQLSYPVIGQPPESHCLPRHNDSSRV